MRPGPRPRAPAVMAPFDLDLAVAAPPAAVWAVLTDPALMRAWHTDQDLPIAADWRPGGALSMAGDWHGLPIRSAGAVQVVDAPRTLAYSWWSSLSGRPETPDGHASIRFDLAGTPAGTRLALRVGGLATPEELGHHRFYWRVALDRVRRLAETGAI